MQVDGVARLERDAARGGAEVFTRFRARVQDRARGIDHHAHAVRGAPGRHGGRHVAALGADARHQQRHVADDRAHLRQLVREGGADHQRALAVLVPFFSHQARHVLVQRLAVDIQKLQVGTARIRGAAQDDDTALFPLHIRFNGIGTHIGIHGDGVGAVALERLARVLGRGGADVAALGVQDQRDVRILVAQIEANVFQLAFRAERREIGDLRLERASQVGGGVDDRRAKGENAVRFIAQFGRQAAHVRVQPDAQQGIVGRPRGG